MNEHPTLTEELDRLEQLLAEARKRTGQQRSSSAATITIHAGSWGTILCCCLFCFVAGLCIPLYLAQRDQQRQLDDMTHYLQAIYQQAPQLKPKEKP